MDFKYIALLMAISLSAVEIKLERQDDVKKYNNIDVQAAKNEIRKIGVTIDDSEARKIIIENKFLTNRFLESYTVDEAFLAKTKFSIEKYLADEYVKMKQKEVDLSDEILESYYVANQKEFIKPISAKITAYRFETFDAAYAFYKSFSDEHDEAKRQRHADENNVTIIEDTIPLQQINTDTAMLINRYGKPAPVLLPPMIYKTFFSVIYVGELMPESLIPFDEAKATIKELLYEKSFLANRDKLLKEMESKR